MAKLGKVYCIKLGRKSVHILSMFLENLNTRKVADSLANTLLSKHYTPFWKEIKKVNRDKHCVAHMGNNVTGKKNITDMARYVEESF